jgi:hypothetical protein
MDNINTSVPKAQQLVTTKFNKSGIKQYVVKIDFPHGIGLDYFWALNGVKTARFQNVDIPQQLNHDAILFLDIDCIPLSDRAIDYYFDAAYSGNIIGNAQRSNHIQNNQHVFAAPSAICLTAETYKKIGMPSAMETARSDVAEEYTWAAESVGVKVDLVMPLRYDNPPQRYEWEGNQPPYWPLADGMPVYGMGTSYGDSEGDLFYHNFQIRMEGQQEKFLVKCGEVMWEQV